MRPIRCGEAPPAPQHGKAAAKADLTLFGITTDYEHFDNLPKFKSRVTRLQYHELARGLLSALVESAPVPDPECCTGCDAVTRAQCSRTTMGGSWHYWTGLVCCLLPFILFFILPSQLEGSTAALFMIVLAAMEIFGCVQCGINQAKWRKKFPADDGETQAAYFTTVLSVLERFNATPAYRDGRLFVALVPSPAVSLQTHVCSPDFKAQLNFYIDEHAETARESFLAEAQRFADGVPGPSAPYASPVPVYAAPSPAPAPFDVYAEATLDPAPIVYSPTPAPAPVPLPVPVPVTAPDVAPAPVAAPMISYSPAEPSAPAYPPPSADYGAYNFNL
eukprot:gnl/Ergobibamus_cyprinoides/1073.p1 GENE.gnl/Ergobibamus_cyprinoides/1073~~gnl/Ergobibamus_cyprinoides/1073.p1  ORF type:complete len:333 (+),score=92.69 gnl/Ergobibamus_cyprinoides/1073:1-999(+)